MQSEAPVILNQGTVLAVGGIMSGMATAIGFLAKRLLEAKEAQLKQEQLAHAKTEADRDYWRDFSLNLLDPTDRVLDLAEERVHKKRTA